MAKRDRDDAQDAPDGETEPTASTKRQKGEDEPHLQPSNGASIPQALSVEDGEDEDDDAGIYLPRSTSRSKSKRGQECPYLDTISRQVRCALPQLLAAWATLHPCQSQSAVVA